MSSIRIIDTRFRILKGGKIGLAMAIGLFGVNSLQAQDFFNSPITTTEVKLAANNTLWTGSGSYYTLTVHGQADNSTTATYSSSNSDIVFKPSIIANPILGATRADASASGCAYGSCTGTAEIFALTNGDFTNDVLKLYLGADSSTEFTVNLAQNSIASTISKADTGTVITYSQNSMGYLQTSQTSATGTNYTANIVLLGNNTITGTTNIGTGNIKLDGSGTFQGAVTAGSINVSTTSNSTFASTISLTDKITYVSSGTVAANNGLSGGIDFASSNGTFTLNSGGISGAINGSGTLNFNNTASSIVSTDIGATTAISNLNINNTGTLSTQNLTAQNITYTAAGTLNISGNLTASSGVNFQTQDGTLSLANGNLSSTVTANTSGVGSVIMGGGTQAINNNLGTSTNKIKLLQIGKAGTISTTTINADINALDTKIYGNSEIQLSSGKNIDSNITTNANGEGTLTLLGGTQTLSNNIGTSSVKLNIVNAAATGATSNFNGNTYANTISLGVGTATFSGTTVANVLFSDAGTANFNSGLTGGINFAGQDATANIVGNANISGGVSTTVNNTGTVTFDSAVDVGFNLGASGNGLKLVRFADDTNVSKNIYSNEIKMNTNKTITLNDGFNLYDTNKSDSTGITTNTNHTGILSVAGTSTVDASVGSSTNIFNQVNAGVTSKTATFNELIYADKLQFSGNGNVVLGGINSTETSKGGIIGQVDFNNGTGTLELKNNVNITTGSNGTTFTNNSNANLKFQGSSTVTGSLGQNSDVFDTIYAGVNSSTVDINGSVKTTNLDYTGTGTVKINGTLSNGSTNTLVDFLSNDGKLEISNGNLNATLTHENAKATLVMANGTQAIYGTIGSNTNKLKKLEIGNTSTTTSFVDIFALDTYIGSTSSTLILDNDKNITSNIIASSQGNGILTFSGGEQTVTGNIGTIYAINSAYSDATTNFENGVNASVVMIGAGTANFNTDDISSTNSALRFNSDDGIANLHTGLVGNIDFFGKAATANLWDGKTITGNIESTGGTFATVNVKGAGTLNGNIQDVRDLNINTEGTSTQITTLNGNVNAQNINLKNDGNVTITAGKSMTGSLATSMTGSQQFIVTDTNNTGSLTLSGNNTITGVIGSSDKVLKTIQAGTTGTDIFNNMVYVQNLNFDGNGTVTLNGTAGIDANTAGLKGNINLASGSGRLELGDNVNITTGTIGTTFENANNADLKFNGTSTVNGVLGGNTDGRSTFKSIYAGANGSIVTFKDDVYVKESSTTPATLHVSGTGIVNLEGDLHGDVNYDNDGTINVGPNKSIIITEAPMAVKTSNNGSGTLNFLGATTLVDADIAESNKMLKAVNFNSMFNNIHQVIDQNIYAVDTTIGNVDGNTTLSFLDVTASYDYAGASDMKEFRGGTSVNLDSNVTFGGNLTLLNATTAINVGVSKITVDEILKTNNGGMSFTVNTKDITGTDEAISQDAGSGKITANTLDITGSEKIRINYVGSLANAGTYTLINASNLTGNYDQNDTSSLVTDNSFSIDTRVHTDNNNLVVAADRTGGAAYAVKDLYVEKSATKGHFSNNAAKVIAGISGVGKQYDDMVEVVQKLEIDSFGYGDTQEKLAVQVKKLAPIVNASLTQTALSATNQIANTVGSRISDIRGLSSGDEVLNKAVWIKLISANGTQDKVGDYDGYTLKSSGAVFGFDKLLDSGITTGLSVGYVKTDTEQTDFRSGDASNTTSYQFTGYGSKTFGKAYVDGSIGYAMHSTDGKRATAIGREASYVADATQISAKVAAGYSFKYNNGIVLTPFASLDYSTVSQDAYNEKDAGSISLSVDGVSFARGSYGLGANVKKDVKLGNSIYTPEFNVGMNQYFGETKVDTIAQFAQGEKFTTEGSTMMKSMFNYGVGVSTKLSERTNISVNADMKQSDNGFNSTDLQFAFKLMF